MKAKKKVKKKLKFLEIENSLEAESARTFVSSPPAAAGHDARYASCERRRMLRLFPTDTKFK